MRPSALPLPVSRKINRASELVSRKAWLFDARAQATAGDSPCTALYCSPVPQTPEMLRVPLEELVLQIHLLRLSRRAEDFLARVLQPPPARAVEGALRTLREVGALSEDEELTPLGERRPGRAFRAPLHALPSCTLCLSTFPTVVYSRCALAPLLIDGGSSAAR